MSERSAADVKESGRRADPPMGAEEASGDLMVHSKPRAFLLGAVFFAVTILLDQAVYFGGNRLVNSGYWSQRLLPGLAAAHDQDLYLLGGCRAAINFDSKLIADSTGLRTFNAAVVADGMGNIDFALGVLLSHHSKGRIVLVIDDGNWEETLPVVRPEIERRLIWWNLLGKREQSALSADYHLQPLLLRSGFWCFKGAGRDLAKALLKSVLRRPKYPAQDGYAPRPAEQNIIPNLSREAELRAGTRTKWAPSEFGRAKVESFVQRALAGGIRPVLVIAPMHRLRATDEVNRTQVEAMRALADKYRLGFLSYLDNHGDLAGNDTLWSDAGHLNRLGSEAFSRIFSRDLRGLREATP